MNHLEKNLKYIQSLVGNITEDDLSCVNVYKKHLSFYTQNIYDKYFWSQFTINKSIINYIKNFMTEYEENYNNRDEILTSLSILITNEIIRGLLKIQGNNNNNITDTEILKAIDYMNANFGDKITLRTLCSVTNMSESNFNKLFREQTGISPIKYLINLRIKKAKKFLRNTEFSITDISMKCGFYSVSHFSSCFTNMVSISPTEYQNLFNVK